MLIVRDGSTWTITSSRVERVGLGSGWTEVVCRTEWPAWVAEAVAQEAERDAVEFREQQERRARAEEEERLARERERAEAVEREVEAARQKAVLKAAREAARLAARAAAREQRAAERRGRARDAIADAETLRLVYASQRGPLAWAANKGGAAALAMWPGAATWEYARIWAWAAARAAYRAVPGLRGEE